MYYQNSIFPISRRKNAQEQTEREQFLLKIIVGMSAPMVFSRVSFFHNNKNNELDKIQFFLLNQLKGFFYSIKKIDINKYDDFIDFLYNLEHSLFAIFDFIFRNKKLSPVQIMNGMYVFYFKHSADLDKMQSEKLQEKIFNFFEVPFDAQFSLTQNVPLNPRL